MPTTMPTISPGQLNRFQGPIPLHLNQQYVRQNTTRTGGLMFPPDIDYDGRKLRRTAMRKTVDYNATIIRALENRIWQRDYRDNECMQPDVLYSPYMLPPIGYENNYTNSVTTRFIKAASNKIRCPVFCQAWTPEGRRLITGTSSGEFTLWNGLTFNFETILQAHDSPVRAMVWSHNDGWMVTGDHGGFIKYWQSNMNNVKMFQAHREPVRGVSFSPSDNKFATCSDDGTVRIWDFFKYEEEHVLRGHGSDVKCVDWHPYKAFIASGSKDSQQPVKLWDPRAGKCLGTLYAHKSTVMDIKWNRNGNWLMTASRDHLLKLFDVRNFSTELQIFRGHKKEASVLAWHPHHEGLICSGGTDGSILFWHVGTDREVAAIEQAHDSIVWALAWHPVGHILCSGSNDHSSKYWSRNLPGDTMRDKYNLNVNPYGGLMSSEERNPDGYIPGMGPEDKVDPDTLLNQSIPGLENLINDEKVKQNRKIPYAKPIPKEFQAAWNDTRRVIDGAANVNHVPVHKDFLQKLLTYAPGVKHVYEISPDALFMYGKLLPVIPNTELEKAIKGGEDILMRFINSGRVLELNMLLPYPDHGNTLPSNAVYQDNRGPMFANENNPKSVDTGSNELRQTSNNDQNSRSNQSTLPPFGHGGDFDMRIPPSSLIHHNTSSTTGEIDFRGSADFKTPYRPTVGVDSRISSSTPQSVHQPLAPPLPPPSIPSLLNRPPNSARPVIQFNTSRFSSSTKNHSPSPSHSNSVTNNNSNSNDNFSRSRFPSSGSQFNSSSNTNSSNSNTNKQQYWSSNFEQHHNEISMGYDTNANDDNDNYPDDDYPESWNNDPPQDDDDYGTMDTDNYDDEDYRYSGSQRSFHEKSSSGNNYWNDRNRSSSSSWNNSRAPPPRWGTRDRGNSGRGFRGNRAGGSGSGGSGGFGGSGGRIPPSGSNRGTVGGSGMTRGSGFRGRGDFPRRSDNKRYPSSNFRSK